MIGIIVSQPVRVYRKHVSSGTSSGGLGIAVLSTSRDS